MSSRDSEAFIYLSQFHRSTSSVAGEDGGREGLRRPLMHRSPMSISAIPSLAHSPTTAASSVSSMVELGYSSLTYDFSSRPLPPRHDPFSAGAGSKMGIDLVTPHIAPSATGNGLPNGASDSIVWEKKAVKSPTAVRNEGIGRLLSESMK